MCYVPVKKSKAIVAMRNVHVKDGLEDVGQGSRASCHETCRIKWINLTNNG